MRTKFRKDTKKCPRCKNVCLNSQKQCDECGLVFARLNEATNKEAKKQFFKKKKSIVMVKDFPNDVVKWQVILMCFLFGVFGVHNLMVGRYYRGGYMLLIGFASAVIASLPTVWEGYDIFMSYFFVFPAILAIMWMVDIFNLVFGFYKIPVALEIKD